MERAVTVGSLIGIVGAPWLPSASNPLVRLLLLLFVVYSIQVSELTGLLSVLAVVSIISERNYRTLTELPMKTHIPMKKDSLFEHTLPPQTMHVEESEYKDNNPRISPVPTGARSAQFYMDKKLSV